MRIMIRKYCSSNVCHRRGHRALERKAAADGQEEEVEIQRPGEDMLGLLSVCEERPYVAVGAKEHESDVAVDSGLGGLEDGEEGRVSLEEGFSKR